MIVGIHQPAYLPWLGYFDRIAAVDRFVYLDTVQFQKGSFQNRNKVLTRNGPVWLTVPVETAGKLFSTTLEEIRIDALQRWQAKHLATLRMSYSAAPMFAKIFPELEPFYLNPQVRLADFCWDMLQTFNRMLCIDTKIVRASELGTIEGRKSDLILNLCRKLGATTYLSGSQGRDYLDVASFSAAGIEVEFQNYVPRPYPQLASDFVPALGVVDYLFNVARPADAFAREGRLALQ